MSRSWAISLILFGFSLPLSAPSAWADTQSNTIPTDLLAANFSVAPNSDGTKMVAIVDLEQVAAVNGVESETSLVQSTNDVVTFTGGGTTITYNPAIPDGNLLPMVEAGTYTLTFTRFNGESYSASVAIPQTATFSAPTPNQVFQKTDAVTVTWAAVQSNLEMLAWSTSCGTTAGDVNVNTTFTGAQIPAGFAAACTGTVSMQFYTVNANIGTGFGSFVGQSQSSVQFSYGAGTSGRPLTYRNLTRRVIAAHRARLNKVLIKL